MPGTLKTDDGEAGRGPHAEYLREVESAFTLIDGNFDTLYDGCKTAQEKQTLRTLHAAARDAYWRAVASSLRDSSPFVREIYDDLASTNQQIRELTANLQSVAAFLNLAKQAVRLAASLVTLATAA